MSLKIGQDHTRFRNIVRGKIRRNLKKYVSQGELIGRQGKDTISIPIPQIDIPRFRFADEQQGGVGQGDGEEGDGVGQGKGKGKPGDGKEAGQGAGQHILEVEITLDELADILGEELALPAIEPKGKATVVDKKDRYVGIRRAQLAAPLQADLQDGPQTTDRSRQLRQRQPHHHPDERRYALSFMEDR